MYNRNCGCNGTRHVTCCPPNVMPTQYAPAQVSPTHEVVRTNIFNTVVPHIHPTHIRNVNRHITHNQHYFPVTESTEDVFSETTRNCGTPENPNPDCFPMRRRRGFFGF